MIKLPDSISLPKTAQVRCKLKKTTGWEGLEVPFQEPELQLYHRKYINSKSNYVETQLK